jgi:hypothetical protein
MYKLLSKHNFSVALALLLTILLSQPNIMNLFFNTILGRTLLVLMILCISYTNHILGVVTTLFVIMIFLCYYNYTEPFGTQQPVSNNTDPNANNTDPNANNTDPNANNTDPNANNTESNVDIDDKYIVTEGFDILGTEQNLQRGKPSNKILVNEDMRKSSNVDPYDGCSHFSSVD